VGVPLDRTGKLPGTIALSVERRKAGPAQSGSAVVALAGGPGQAALPLAGFIAEAIAPALSGRDLIVFDQRGTGSSGPLHCAAIEGGGSGTSQIPLCATQLGPSRADYTTAESVEDIEAIRKATGYEKLVLYGTSYGTLVALQYAERYPKHVEALVLDSTETPTGPEPFYIPTFQAMRTALAELCAHHACPGSPSPVAELAKVVARTEADPPAATVVDGRGKRHHLRIDEAQIFGLLLGGDLNPILRAGMPAAIHAAYHRDLGPLAQLLLLAGTGPSGGSDEGIDEALFLTTSCEETRFPWSRAAPAATRVVEAEAALNALTASDFYPFGAESSLFDGLFGVCVGWPDASPAPAEPTPLPDVPTLIFSGGQDLRTPRSNALAVAKLIPDAQVLAVPFTGHSVIGADPTTCSKDALQAFFTTGTIAQCPSTTNDIFPPAPAPPERLSQIAALHGTHGAGGRTATAALDTVAEVRMLVSGLVLNFGKVPSHVHFGGLRGGYMTLTASGVQLHGLSYVPGVTLSGRLPIGLLRHHPGTSAELTISGSAATHGRLRLPESGELTGALGGHAIHARVPASANVASAATGTSALAWLTQPLPGASSPLARIP
jgi:pimeloyl-ACP methyl ester carboxylesterase